MISLKLQILLTTILGFLCGFFLFHSPNLSEHQNNYDPNYFNRLMTRFLLPSIKPSKITKTFPSIYSSLTNPDDNFDKDWPSQLAQRVKDTRCKWAKIGYVYTACKHIAKKCHAEHEDYYMQDMCVQRGILENFNIKFKSIDDR